MMTSPAAERPWLCNPQRLRLPWGWVIVVASFVVYTVLFGILYSYNVLFIAFKEEFNSSITVTGWIGSVSIGLSLLLAPVVNILIERFGCRTVAVFGIVSGGGAVLVTSFLTNVFAVFVVYGLVFGVGGGLVTVCAYDVVLLHFPERNSMRAMAFLLTGTSFGMLSFTPLMSFIISKYGWRVLLRILGPLLIAVGLPCVSTYVEPSKPSEDGSHGNKHQKIIYQRHEEKEEPAKVKQLIEDPKWPVNDSEKPFLSVSDKSHNSTCEDLHHGTPTPAKTTVRIKEYHQISDFNSYTDRVRYADGFKNDPKASGDPCLSGEMRCKEILRHVEKVSGKSMTKKILVSLTFPELWLISIGTLLNGIGDCFFLVNLINYMISVGFPEQVGVTVVSIIGLSNLVGKIVMSLAGEYIPFPRVFLLVIASMVSIAVMLVIMFTRNHIIMYCVAVVVGGVTMTTTNTITYSLSSEFFGPERALETSAVLLFTYGLGYVLGSLVGQSIDSTGSYTNGIWAFVGMYTVSGMFVLLAPAYQRFFAPHRFVTFELYRLKKGARKKAATSAPITIACENNFNSTSIVFERVTCL